MGSVPYGDGNDNGKNGFQQVNMFTFDSSKCWSLAMTITCKIEIVTIPKEYILLTGSSYSYLLTSRNIEAFSLCFVFTSTEISEWSPMERRAPAQGSSRDQCI